MDLVSYVAGTIIGHFRDGTGRAQYKIELKLRRSNLHGLLSYRPD